MQINVLHKNLPSSKLSEHQENSVCHEDVSEHAASTFVSSYDLFNCYNGLFNIFGCFLPIIFYFALNHVQLFAVLFKSAFDR